jgi:ATP-dependent DNA helicase RecG
MTNLDRTMNDELLGDKLSDVLDDKQKESKVKNLLTSLRRSEVIEHKNGNHRKGVWVLVKK